MPLYLAFRIFLACMASIWLTACGHDVRERIVTQEVKVPVPCMVDLPPVSELPIHAKPVATDIFDQMKAALASIDLLSADLMESRAAVKGCNGE